MRFCDFLGLGAHEILDTSNERLKFRGVEKDFLATVDINYLVEGFPSNLITTAVAYVYLGDDKASADDLRWSAIPFPLPLGAHYHAFVLWEQREKFNSPAKAF